MLFPLKRYAMFLPLLWLSCTHPENRPQPLGLGPLALAEQKTRIFGASQALKIQTTDTVKEEKTETLDETKPQAEPTAPPTTVAKTPTTNENVSLADASVTPPLTTIDDWLGFYQGSDVTRYVMEGQPDRNYDDPNAKIRVERGKENSVAFVFVDSSNGQDLCTLRGDVVGNEATLPPGQRCFIDPDEGMTVSSQPGSAKRDGNKLVLNVVLETTLELEEASTSGRIEYEFEGVRR